MRSIFISLVFFATGLVGQELKFSGGESFAPGQFVDIKFDISASEQPLLLIAEPVDLEHASHKVDGKLVFYTAMPNQPIVMWVLLQKAVNGTIETKRHKIVLKPTGVVVPDPVPDPAPTVQDEVKPYYDQLALIQKKIKSADCVKIRDILIAQAKVVQPVQALIDNTFEQVQGVISTDVQKAAWKPFFDWLENHLKEEAIPVGDKDKYLAVWGHIAEAFDAISKPGN